ncbi:archaellin/type IV pilin N-terminal domain-containing protein [Methanosphaerula subterraneus]|uniref:archaellin/type IV pilin N-terminal domain-containing protein n=1 Tax=Methanosphaerula subterraneus TaxID=3350244 RepID=UPI003F825FA0
MKSVRRNEDAFTGLEAAIVLIAFVVVAAVFSYVVLGAGFFTTQKSQETVHTAVGQASSAVEIMGNVYGEAASGGAEINKITFSIGLAAGGTPVDVNKTVLTFSTGEKVQTLVYDQTATSFGEVAAAPPEGHWVVSHEENSITTVKNGVLDNGEQFTITVTPPVGLLTAYTGFDIDIKPPVGAALAIHRTVPAYIEQVNLLY